MPFISTIDIMPIYKILIFYFLCLHLNLSCKQIPQNKKKEEDKILRPDIEQIVNQIANYQTVDAGGVGIAGVKTEQYERFEKLIKYAKLNELIILTDDKSAAVRAYSFWALAKKHFPGLELIVKKHANDTSSFRFFSGCILLNERVNDFYVSIIKDSR